MAVKNHVWMMLAISSSVGGSACAMSPSAIEPKRCEVAGEELLPPEAGDARSLCAAIDAAVADRAPKADHRITIRVISASSLLADVKLGGVSLPEQKLAVSDRKLNKSSISRFAASVADEIGKASK